MKTKGYFCLLKKEIKEQFKNAKSIILLIVFAIFAIASPIAAKYLPQILSNLSETQNMQIVLAEPTWVDAVNQYVKNLSQMISFILILVYMGLISKEKESGTLVFLLVKPIRKSDFILAKFTSVVFIIALGMLLSFLLSSLYINLLFGYFDILNYLLINALMFLYLLTLTFITLCFSSIFRSQIAAGVMSFVVLLIMNLILGIGKIGEILPSALLGEVNVIIAGGNISLLPIFSSIAFLLVFLVISLAVFRRWEA
jgi:ABC-2 type transport system permease protein